MHYYKLKIKKYRFVLTLFLILITLAIFVYYLMHHKSSITTLKNTDSHIVISLLMLYVLWFIAICLVVWSSLRLCRKKLSLSENVLLNGYSSLVNFFVPGQGGIAIRGLYLNKTKKLSIRKFIYITLIYYMFYAVISAVLLLITNRPWWQTIAGVVLTTLISFLVIYLFKKRNKSPTNLIFSFNTISILILVTLIQAVIQVSIFYIELHSINSHIVLSQVITYTGAANFSLFVSLTPGAIGIREGFLLFTRHLSHISVGNIVAASILDRAVFFIFLGILFIVTASFHAKYKLVVKDNTVSNENY